MKMSYKESKKNLLKEGIIKEGPQDYKAIMNLIKRAFTDIETAKRNLTTDEECSYNFFKKAICLLI